MKTFYLHIGIAKTGTSSLQEFLFQNRDKLLAEKILYPITGLWGDHSHHKIGFAVTGATTHGVVESLDYYLNELNKEIKNSGCDSVIISSEILRIGYKRDNIKKLLNFINERFDKLIFVMYIRKQEKWLESMYRQRVKDPNIALKLSINKFIRKFKNHGDFFHLYKEWEKILPSNSEMRIEIYEEKSNNPNYSSINSFLNIIHATNLLKTEEVKVKNRSMNAVQIIILRYLNILKLAPEKEKM